MKRYCLFGVAVLSGSFLLPALASASVRINEIAWMGTKDSTSHEWIELYNDGSDSVSLEGWKLESSNFSIALKGAIASGDYFLIKRTSDFSEIASADLVASFGSGLKNTGDTLRVRDASSAVVDEVMGGDSWKSIGGDNSTKNTASRNGDNWCTATPTARSANGACVTVMADSASPVASDSSVTNSSNDASSDRSSNDASSVKSAPSLHIDGPSKVSVRSENEFIATVTGDGLYDVAWNFGDGTTGTGASVSHRFNVPGASVVVLSARVNGKDITVSKKVTIEALNVRVALAVPGAEGYVQISSRSDVDISGWSLRAGSVRFDFPRGTELLSGMTAGFSNSVTGMFDQSSLALFDASDRLVFAKGGESGEADKDVAPDVPISFGRSHDIPRASAQGVDTNTATETIALSDPKNSLAQSAYAGGLGNTKVWPYWAGLFAIISVSCGIAYVASRRLDAVQLADDDAAKYTIIEMDSNLHEGT